MKKFMEEFKKFALRGNVMDLAIGVIIGAAFQNIVTALTNSFINPLIALVTGGVKTDPETGAPIYVGGQFTILGVSFDYGSFLSAIINFLIMALMLFLLMKGVNKLMTLGKKKEEEAPKTTKICPFCKSEIAKDATKCPHCTSEVPVEE